jgi:hypothetical protein
MDEYETGVVGECLVGAVWIFVGTVDDVDVACDLRQGIIAFDRRRFRAAAGKQQQDGRRQSPKSCAHDYFLLALSDQCNAAARRR